MKTCKSCGASVQTYDRECAQCHESWPAERPWKERGLKELLFSFEGRLGRKPFILGTLISLIPAYIMKYILDIYLLTGDVLYLIVDLIIAVPTVIFALSLDVRRWHDMNKSGYFVILCIVANVAYLVSVAVLAYMAVKKGTPDDNRYGSALSGELFLKK